MTLPSPSFPLPFSDGYCDVGRGARGSRRLLATSITPSLKNFIVVKSTPIYPLILSPRTNTNGRCDMGRERAINVGSAPLFLTVAPYRKTLSSLNNGLCDIGRGRGSKDKRLAPFLRLMITPCPLAAAHRTLLTRILSVSFQWAGLFGRGRASVVVDV